MNYVRRQGATLLGPHSGKNITNQQQNLPIFFLSARLGQLDWDGAVAQLKDADNFPPKTTESGPASLRFYLKLPIIKGRWLGCHSSLPDATFNDILSILLFFFLHFSNVPQFSGNCLFLNYYISTYLHNIGFARTFGLSENIILNVCG